MSDILVQLCARLSELETKWVLFTKQQEHDKERITYVNQLVIDLRKDMERYGELDKGYFDNHRQRIEELERLTKHVLSTQRLTDNRVYMSAKEAMRHLFAGYKLTRRNWVEGAYGDSSGYIKIGDIDSTELDISDLEANDWYIV